MSGFEGPDQPGQDQLNNCIRCGMCLPSCPTYQLTGKERSSPRGRISLIRAVAEGNLPLESAAFQQEMDDCLGCLGCVTACPAGVQYGELLESARAQIRKTTPPPWWVRLVEGAAMFSFERSWVLQAGTRLLYLYQRSGLARLIERSGVLKRLPGHLQDFHELMPSVPWRGSRQQLPQVVHPDRPQRGQLAVLLGCVMDVVFARENVATVEVLKRQGFACWQPSAPVCCGALHAHAGQLDRARTLAKQWIVALEERPVDALIVNSAGCGNCMKHYPQLFHDDPEWQPRARQFADRVKDVQEFLCEIELNPPLPHDPGDVTYHDACHLAHGQGVRRQPRQLLQKTCGSGYRELADADLCCGSAGTYNVTHFENASKLLERKVAAIEQSGAKRVGVANPGCLLQIRYGLKRAGSAIKAEHPVTILNEAWNKSNNPLSAQSSQEPASAES